MRDTLEDLPAAIAFWIPDFAVESFSSHCPDLLAWRSWFGTVTADTLSPESPATERRRQLSEFLRETPWPSSSIVETKLKHGEESLAPEGWSEFPGRLLVVDRPGTGKSSFAEQLAFEIACRGLHHDSGPIPDILRGPELMPDGWKQLSSRIRARSNLGLHSFIIVDGLDEMPLRTGPSEVIQVHDQLLHLDASNDVSHILVTTRPGAAQFAPATWPRARIDVPEASHHQIIERLIAKQHGSGTAKTRALTQGFRTWSYPWAEGLVNTRVLLEPLIEAYELQPWRPARRADRYGESLDLLLTGWDTQRSLPHRLTVDNQDLQRLLETAAYHLLSTNQSQIGQDTLAPLLQDPDGPSIVESQPDQWHTALEFIAPRSGLIEPASKDKWTFSSSNAGFVEYLAARELHRQGVQLDAFAAQFPHLDRSRWGAIARFLVEMDIDVRGRDVVLAQLKHQRSNIPAQRHEILDEIVKDLGTPDGTPPPQ